MEVMKVFNKVVLLRPK